MGLLSKKAPEDGLPKRTVPLGDSTNPSDSLGDVEFRADLDPAMYFNPFARLGYDPTKGKVMATEAATDHANDDYYNIGYPDQKIKQELDKIVDNKNRVAQYFWKESEPEFVEETLLGDGYSQEQINARGVKGDDIVMSPAMTQGSGVWTHEYTHRGLKELEAVLGDDRDTHHRFMQEYGAEAYSLLMYGNAGEYLAELFDTEMEGPVSKEDSQDTKAYLASDQLQNDLKNGGDSYENSVGHSGVKELIRAAQDLLEYRGEPDRTEYAYAHGGLVHDEMEALGLSTPDGYTLSGGLPKEVAPVDRGDTDALEAAIIEMRRKEAAGEEYSSYTPPVEEATTFYDKDDQDFLEYRAPEEPVVATPSPTIAEAPTVPTVAPVEPVAYVYTDARGTDNTRGVRNNNPLNIEQGSNAWDGLATDQSADERFAVFDDAEHGIRAAIRTLVTYQVKHDLQTPSAMITRWAPPWKTDRLGNFLLDAAGNKIQENDTAAYISTVARVSGLDANSSLVIGDNIETKELIKGMILMENGGDAMRGYSDETYNKALDLAFPERIEVGVDDRQAYVDLTDWDNAIV